MNNGLIKSSPTDVDFIIVNEGMFDCMDIQYIQEERLSQTSDITKGISFIHESNYKSRIAKLVTQVPKKKVPEITKPLKDEQTHKLMYNNFYTFLANDKVQILTLSDMYDVINRQESSKQSHDWFKKRLRPFLKDQPPVNYNGLFCVASFYRLTDGFNKELDHICHFHEFEEMENSDKIDEMAMEYLKKTNPKIFRYKRMKFEVPLVNKAAPQGTAVFQTFYEYNYGKW